MGQSPVVAEVTSVQGHRIRLTLRQWLHITENHDYMAGNRAWSWRRLPTPMNSWRARRVKPWPCGPILKPT